MRSTGISSARLGIESARERPLERGQRQLVGAKRALERMAAQPLDELGAPDDDPRLRAAEELVAREADEVGARARGSRPGSARRRAGERARAEVVDERHAVLSARPRPARASRGLLGEADDPEVRLVHAEQQRRLGADRALVVGRARPVRRPHLDEARAGAREHVRDAEAVADLDQLAARDDHLASLGERGEREQHRRRVVVDDERGLGAREPPEERPRGDPAASRARPRSRSYSRFE